MKTHASTLFCILAACSVQLAHAGPLDPPGGPIAPTGKTLTEVEPRIAINATNTPGNSECVYRITQPGSYYLTGNLSGATNKHTILIQTVDVTIDLNGFKVSGVPTGLSCIATDGGRVGITIKNGTVAAGGSNGISLGSMSAGSRLVDLVIDNCAESSVYTGPTAMVERCVVNDAETQGFVVGNGSVLRDCVINSSGDTGYSVSYTTLENCTANNCASHGFYAIGASTLKSCTAVFGGVGFYCEPRTKAIACTATKTTGNGFIAASDVIMENCVASSCGVYGITAGDRSVVRECQASANTVDGIVLASKCTATGNICADNGPLAGNIGAGIRVNGTDCRIEANSVTGNDLGIRLEAAGNIILRNTASGNGTNFSSVAGNAWGTIVAATSSAAINGNTGGGLGSTDPNANFAY